jgi:hypothetical protein
MISPTPSQLTSMLSLPRDKIKKRGIKKRPIRDSTVTRRPELTSSYHTSYLKCISRLPKSKDREYLLLITISTCTAILVSQTLTTCFPNLNNSTRKNNTTCKRMLQPLVTTKTSRGSTPKSPVTSNALQNIKTRETISKDIVITLTTVKHQFIS